MLLMSLDPPTAAELLQSAKPETVTEIAAELTYLGQGGSAEVSTEEPIKEFFTMLYRRETSAAGSFVEQMLKLALGEVKSREAMAKVNEQIKARDPFRDIRGADPAAIAEALAGEAPQVVAVVLSELPPKKSTTLLGLLDDATRPAAVRCMTRGQDISVDAKVRVASIVQSRLDKPAAAAAELASVGGAVTPAAAAKRDNRQDEKLRKVALLLRGLEGEAREVLLTSLAEQDQASCNGVRRMMVIWSDIPIVADRPLQESMRKADSRALALALVGADAAILAKIRSNISERAKAMLDEETQLLNKPKSEDIEQAREKILSALRDLNNTGEFQFEEGQG